MAGKFSNGEDSVGHEAELLDAAADIEVDLCLPLREPILQDRPREEIPSHSGVLDLVARMGSNRKGPDMACRYRLLWMHVITCWGLHYWWQGPTQAVVDRQQPGRQQAGIDMPARFQFSKAADLRSPEGSMPPGRKQFEPDPFGAGLLWRFDPDHGARVPAGNVESDLIRSPGAVLVVDMEELRPPYNCSLTWRVWAERCSPGAGVERATRAGLVSALSAHYGSPGRLADYRRQFEKMTRTVGEDPSIFATALDTLAVKAFGDMGQTSRLCIIRDRFIASPKSAAGKLGHGVMRCQALNEEFAFMLPGWKAERAGRGYAMISPHVAVVCVLCGAGCWMLRFLIDMFVRPVVSCCEVHDLIAGKLGVMTVMILMRGPTVSRDTLTTMIHGITRSGVLGMM